MDSAKKDGILAAAARSFRRFGFKKASIDEIAQHAGVGKGTIYLAAASKKDLFFQVIEREVTRWTRDVAKRVPLTGPVDEVLEALLAEEVRSLAKRPLIVELMVGRVVRTLPAFCEKLEDLRRTARLNLLEALRIGARSGLLRRDLDLEEVAVLLQDLQTTALMFCVDAPERDSVLLHRWQTTVAVFVHGLQAPQEARAVA